MSFAMTDLTWIEEQKLTASDSATDDYFGRAVSLDGDCALIGAFRADVPNENGGAAYVFRYNGDTWTQDVKFRGDDYGAGAEFGTSVSLLNDIALVGAPRDNENDTHSGAAYVFRYNGSNWSPREKIVASDGAEWAYLGSAVAISGDLALIGAPGVDNFGESSGAVYIFHYDGADWIETAIIQSYDVEAMDNFGGDISLSDGIALVGARENDDACPSNPSCNSGSAYLINLTCLDAVSANLECTPSAGTLPFSTNMQVTLTNNCADWFRRVAAHVDVTLGGGNFFSYWRAGFTNLDPNESYIRSWSQQLPALGTLVGENDFDLIALDVTPYPYNQPPHPPAGDTDTATCTVTGIAP